MAEVIEFKPKMRITLLEDNGAVISDRLVDFQSEVYAGPKIQHNGPIRLEVTLANTASINQIKGYIDQLSGQLPIKEITGRGRPSTATAPTLTESPREDILLAVENMVKDGATQAKVIKYLRSLGFVFILTEDFLLHFPDFDFDKKDIGEPTTNHQYLNSRSWMVRCIKRAKDPKADKFDPMIIFGFNILSKPSSKVVPYLYRERKTPIKVSGGKKVLSFSSVEFTRFPKYVTEEERVKFSFEQRQLLNDPKKKPSKFFLRWYRDVMFPDSIKDQIEEIVKRGQDSTTT